MRLLHHDAGQRDMIVLERTALSPPSLCLFFSSACEPCGCIEEDAVGASRLLYLPTSPPPSPLLLPSPSLFSPSPLCRRCSHHSQTTRIGCRGRRGPPYLGETTLTMLFRWKLRVPVLLPSRLALLPVPGGCSGVCGNGD